MKNCEICTEQPSKYRCPKCSMLYCSLGCYKQHKDSCLKIAESKDSTGNKLENEAVSEKVYAETIQEQREDGEVWSDDSDREQYEMIDDDEDRVAIEKLKKLGDSEELRALLQNRHLRDIISYVDDADNDSKNNVILKAMQEPLFTEFADECLKIVEGDKITDTG
ncbi:zinc finger HIT domain-containing protein 3-like [Glandiceps talaboti]